MNLYVANLNFDVTEEMLRKLFSEQGQVGSVKIITDYNTGYSRGFAFVDMPNDQEGEKAISKLNNASLNNKNISVQIARPKEEKPKRNDYPERDGFKRR